MDTVRRVSLLDLADREAISWYVCYTNRENPRFWNRFLKPEYQHVQLRKPYFFGPEMRDVLWLVVDPGLSHVSVTVRGPDAAPWTDPEIKHVQRVEAAPDWRRVRQWFFFGPITCVEIVKAYLGISSHTVRTPFQLFNYIKKRGSAL